MSADPRPMLAAFDCILHRKPLIECANAIMQADRVNPRAEAEMDAAIADLERLHHAWRSPRIKAVKVASALGKPELADEILQALHAHDDCEVGFIVRRA